MTIQQLTSLATRIRHNILVMTTQAQSGHPTSSLSAVELMVALMFTGLFRYDVKNPKVANNDRLIFSKGHATPLFYALWEAAGALTSEQLKQYRTFESSLEGHPSMRFPHTVAPTGSLGQGLSIGAGIALNAKYLDQLPYKTFVLLGDSELAEGSNWEAIQFATEYKLNNLIGVLDVNRLGQRGETMYGHDLKEYSRKLTSFGWQVAEIHDGHNFEEILQAYSVIQEAKQPVMFVARTIKGKGVAHWEDKNNWHSKQLSPQELEQELVKLGPVDKQIRGEIVLPENLEPQAKQIEHTITLPEITGKKPSKYGAAVGVLDQLKNDSTVVVLDAEVSNSTHLQLVKEQAADNFFEMYIMEQNMVGVSVGLARCGKTPVISSFAAFLSRAYDQVRMAQYADVNLKIFGSYAGVSLGKDGFSQMALEDIAFFRTIQNSLVLQPADAVSAAKLAKVIFPAQGIVYFRTTREPVENIYQNDDQFVIGGSHVLQQSTEDQVTVIASGITVHEALEAYQQLVKQNIKIRVIDLYSIKPIDRETLLQAVKQSNKMLVVEDHAPEGGIAEAVRSALWDQPVVVGSLAVRKVPRSGTPAELLAYEEIDAAAIVKTVKEMMG